MAWRWTARRLIISAFVIFHMSALSVWTMPSCVLKTRIQPALCYYLMPTGLWQWWAIFAPVPIQNTLMLNAEVIDSKGMRHIYQFPRLGDMPWWQRVARYRQPKFTANMCSTEYARHREFSSKYAVRQLNLGAEAFPMSVSLYYHIRDTPPPGTGAADPLIAPRIEMLDRFQFASLKEVRP